MNIKSKISLLIFIVILLVVGIFGVYLVLPDSSISMSYINISSTNNYSREDFYTEYLDLVLNRLNEKDTDENENILSNSITAGNNTNNVQINNSDLVALAQQIATTFKNSSGDYEYGGSHKLQDDWTIGNKALPKGTVIRHDCSGFVSAMCYFMGADTTYTLRVSNGFKCFPKVETDTFEGAQVGDIMCTEAQSHVAIIVKVDDEYVYFGDCGQTGPITKTATQGYSQKFKKTDKISSWRKKEAYLHRPSWSVNINNAK